MPVCMIEGPSGLSKDSKKELMRTTLKSLVKAYQMPDDRVFVRENPDENIGHTGHDENVDFIVQSGKARPICIIQAPQGLPLDAKRVLMSELTDHIVKAYELTDLRDVLIFIQEYPLDVVANNGLLQSENPEFASPSTN